MKIIVLNKQKQHKVSITDLKLMAESLSTGVLSNLEKDRPNWIKASVLTIVKKQAALNLIIVSQSTIKKLNKKWLGKDEVTDVLSFPLLDLSLLKIKKATNENNLQHPKEELLLGEIFIAYEKACEQANDYNHSIDRELAFLFVHGMLHVLGFDHQDKISEKDMFGRQKRVLKKSGYPRLSKN